MNLTWIGCSDKNYTVGRQGKKVELVIVHWIVGTLQSADATFANPTRQASAHYGVGGDQVHQYVKEDDTAWHATNWPVNLTSIGIEHEGGPELPITDATYQTSAHLIADICSRYGIPIDRNHIKGHKEVSDKPTACPGALDVDRLVRMANEILNPPPSAPQINDQTIIDLGQYGQLEVQAIRGKMGDLVRLQTQAQDLDHQLQTKLALIADLEYKISYLEVELKQASQKPPEAPIPSQTPETSVVVPSEVSSLLGRLLAWLGYEKVRD
jgi:hypothetical protein